MLSLLLDRGLSHELWYQNEPQSGRGDCSLLTLNQNQGGASNLFYIKEEEGIYLWLLVVSLLHNHI